MQNTPISKEPNSNEKDISPTERGDKEPINNEEEFKNETNPIVPFNQE